MNNVEAGRLGELMAAEKLARAGYLIIAMNYHTPFGEIDIIAKRRGMISFVEVKTRNGSGYGQPVEAVTSVKQSHIRKAASCFLQQNPHIKADISFDVISINVDHLKNVF